MSGRTRLLGERMRQARGYRGIRRPRVTFQRTTRTDRMSYPRTHAPGENNADDTGADDTGADDTGAAGVPASPRFPDIEKRILDFWKTDGTFEASIEARE